MKKNNIRPHWSQGTTQVHSLSGGKPGFRFGDALCPQTWCCFLPIPTRCSAVSSHARNTGSHPPRFNFNSLGKKSTSLQTWIIRPSVKRPRVGWMTPHAVLCLVTQSCLTHCDPMDCSPPGSSVHGDAPGKNTGVGSLSFLQGIFPTQESNRVSCIAGRFFTSWATREVQMTPHPTPPRRYTPLEPGKLTLFGKRIFADVIKL